MAYVINQELCSCCHRCRVECPAGAVRFRNSKYWIDPEKCISCGHCAEICHNNVISNPDAEPAPAVQHPDLDLSCDVLVIGGGASGLAAGARAADLGKKVLVLEKNREIGGSAWYAHVFRNYYSRWHEEAGLPDTRDQVYRDFMEHTEGHVDGKLVRRILDADTGFVDWLIEKYDLGKDYSFGPQFWGGYGPRAEYDWDYNHRRIDTTIGPGGNGWYLCSRLLDILRKNGGGIRYLTEAEHLLTDGSGAVVGALARDPGGILKISCRSCVVAAGAFSRNRELMARFNPEFYQEGAEPVHVFTCSTCTGDGITLCDELGADIDYRNARAGMFGPMRHPFGTASIAAATSRYGILVNAEGSIFDDSGSYGAAVSPLAHEPKRIAWKITNEASIARAEQESLGRAEDVPGCDMNRFYRDWKRELAQEAEWETLYIADTLEELGEKLGIPGGKLEAAVSAYNRTCGKPEQGMTPGGPATLPPREPITSGPYYGILMKLFHENAIGGVVIDENTAVLRNGKPVPGLYAAGDNTRGIMLPGRVGSDYIESVISALTFAFSSGFLAGEESAAHAGS